MIRIIRLLCLMIVLGGSVPLPGRAQRQGDVRQTIRTAQEIPREHAEQQPMYVFTLVNTGDAIDTVSLRLLDPSTLDPITVEGSALCNPCGYVLKPGHTEQVNVDELLERVLQQARQNVRVLGLLSAGQKTRITLTYAMTAPIEPLVLDEPWAGNRKTEFSYPISDK